jgi:hypothetical protein
MTKINIKTKGTEVSVKTDFDANDIVKLITGIEQQQNIPMSVNTIELSSLFQEDKPFKSKAIIKKVNSHTIEVDGTRLSLNNLPKTNEFKKAGTDYCVLKDADDKYSIAQADTEEFDEYSVIGGFHYGLIPEDFEARNNITQKQVKKIRGMEW